MAKRKIQSAKQRVATWGQSDGYSHKHRIRGKRLSEWNKKGEK